MLDELIKKIFLTNSRLLPATIRKNYKYTSIKIDVSDLNSYRSIDWAEIRIPDDFFTTGKANIYIDKKYCLKIPHVESNGKVCIGVSDFGSFSEGDPVHRIGWLITSFQDDFIIPWNKDQLYYDFIKEPSSYWNIYVNKMQSLRSLVKHVYVDMYSTRKNYVFNGKLLSNSKTIVASDIDDFRLSNLINSIKPGDTIINVDVVVVNIDQPFSPSLWPRTHDDVIREIRYNAGIEFTNKFIKSLISKRRKKHHLVIFNHIDNQYGYLMPSNLKTVENYNANFGRTITRNIIQDIVLPLKIKRIDQNWIVGRDTIPTVNYRSNLKILVIGCGALGGFIINHLAQSGIGNITIVDDGVFESENISRHSLGLNSIRKHKVFELQRELGQKSPHCNVNAFPGTFIGYANRNDVNDYDLIIDVSGEDNVALEVEVYRDNTPLLKAWMEPYASAAHACYFTPNQRYKHGFIGRLKCAEWPSEVMTKLPGCSSYFQSYTVTAAAFCVAMTSELIMEVLDGQTDKAIIRTWLREESYFSKFHVDVKLFDWTKQFASQYGQVIDRDFND